VEHASTGRDPCGKT